MRESKIEREVCEAASRAGWLVLPKVGAGLRGWPDRVFAKHYEGVDFCSKGLKVSAAGFPHDRLLFVEFKSPRGKLTKLQAHCHEQLRALGFDVQVIDGIEAGEALFK